MEYETSYVSGLKPFQHDRSRGKWESPKDFLFACLGHAFRPEVVTVVPLIVFEFVGIYSIIPYLLILAVCVVPIVFIQSFLGQFSGTGFISAFRIAPLFKGIGYVSLVLNFVNLTYYSIFIAIPIFYFLHSLNPIIPWSCEGASKWMDINQTICGDEIFTGREVPSVEFLTKQFNLTKCCARESGTVFSLELIIYTAMVWAAAIWVILRCTEHIGRFLRYSFMTMAAIMGLCILRFIFLPEAFQAIYQLFVPIHYFNLNVNIVIFVPIMAFSTFGPGWGSVLTMASFNKFKTNIYNYSWLICLVQYVVLLGTGVLLLMVRKFMRTTRMSRAYKPSEWEEFLSFLSGLTFVSWPNLWTILFVTLFGLGFFNILIIQLLSFFTSLFDEFESLRENKRNVILGTSSVLLVTSFLFCSNHGVAFFEVLLQLSTITQIILNLLVLLVVLWIYGRERFQRDLNFMTDQTYATWKIFIVRFVAPILLVIGFIYGWIFLIISLIFKSHITSSAAILILVSLLFFPLSWCFIPCYCIVKIKQTAGKIGIRLKRCVRPTDWYPADPEFKQSYEERFSTVDTSHSLTIATGE